MIWCPMAKAHVNCYIDASADRVFDLISDHAGLSRWPGIRSSRLLERGAERKNGVGAVREVISDIGVRLVEAIIAFEPPQAGADGVVRGGYEYRIRKANLPIEHQHGRVQVIARHTGTEVDWQSVFSTPVPVLGSVMDRMIQPLVVAGFTEVLLAIKRTLAPS